MRLHFLGGASEVGASCLLLEVDGKRILIDAGIRMQKRDGSQLPDLARLQELGAPDALLLTHAHTDHIGALPLVHLAFPQMPIYASEPTKALSRVLLQDSLRIMESRWDQEEEIPLYPPHAVEGMLGRMVTVEPGQPVPVLDSLVATYVPSGHILGACSITLETPEGVLLFAGDYSLDRQHTIEGMTLPAQRPDLMVTESTYGNRIHSNRRQEEERLCTGVAEVIASGGKALIPSFALGRAQEVILILLEAQRSGRLPNFPVVVDGMVKTMCSVYHQFPQWLQPSLRRSVAKSGNPFFYPGGAHAVLHNERNQIFQGGPCAIVASSGMLTGGASKMYAERLIHDPKNAIFITGYQDEESPGAQLLNLVQEVEEKGEGMLRLDGQLRRVLCKVRRFGLSAHADGGQLLNVVCRMDPKHVVLVHGDQEARGALGTTFPPGMKVHLPANGDCLEIPAFRSRRSNLGQAVYAGLAGSADQPLNLDKLHATLVQKNGGGRRYTVQELAQAWHGRPTPAQAEGLALAVAAAPHLFKNDPHRPFLYTAVVAPANRVSAPQGKKQSDHGQVIKMAQASLGHLTDLEKIGARYEQKTLVLTFLFPDRAVTRYAPQLEQLAADTGWAVELNPRPSVPALNQAVRECLPLVWDIGRTSVYPNEKRVRTKVLIPCPVTPEELEAAKDRYLERTGRLLEIEILPEPPAPKEPFDQQGRMEQNAAHQHIRKVLAAHGVALLNFSRRAEPSHLELGLISPQVAARHADLIAQLASETGWELRTRPQPNNQALGARVCQLLPPDWNVQNAPSVFPEERYIRLRIPGADLQLCQQASVQLELETGFKCIIDPSVEKRRH